ncbi:hypothetical protein [Pseudomonas salmasensis]|uniref:hypothetical protein n=1 Tax=Pseudomonas salmasensis TaxID=2745514 RepID=UPI001C3C2CC0|nr:hypothetical protein [Pseudomonas salmasensis]QXH81071.1 hypothetical protein HU731_004355 [Pseudomonas salmasensis]
MLAKIVNDNACCLIRRVVLGFFASKLAPTVVFAVPINRAHTKTPGITGRFVFSEHGGMVHIDLQEG